MADGRTVRTVEETETRVEALENSESLLRPRVGEKGSETWWSASASSVEQATAPTIPLPPQIKQERMRHEAARAAAAKAESLRREMAQRDEERRRAVQKAINVSVRCDRCGTVCNESSGKAFSFCAECGADLPNRARAAAPGMKQRTMPPAPGQQMASVTAAAAGVTTAGLNQTTTATGQTVVPTRQWVSPRLAAFSSFLLPGVGQLLNGQPEKGIMLLLGMYIMAFLFSFSPMSLPLIAVRVIVALDAYRIAERRRRGRPIRSGEWDIS